MGGQSTRDTWLVAASPCRGSDFVLFEQACDGGVASGCHNLGVAYQRGLGVTNNELKAWELFARACAAGASKDCGIKLRTAGGTFLSWHCAATGCGSDLLALDRVVTSWESRVPRSLSLAVEEEYSPIEVRLQLFPAGFVEELALPLIDPEQKRRGVPGSSTRFGDRNEWMAHGGSRRALLGDVNVHNRSDERHIWRSGRGVPWDQKHSQMSG
jgi:TPR repeat protein